MLQLWYEEYLPARIYPRKVGYRGSTTVSSAMRRYALE